MKRFIRPTRPLETESIPPCRDRALAACVVALALLGCGESQDPAGSTSSGQGGEALVASLVRPGEGAVVQVRIDGGAFGPDDDDPTRWRLRVGDADVKLDQAESAAVFAVRAEKDPKTIEGVYLQAHVAASEGDEVVVEHPASSGRWIFEGRAAVPTRFPVHPILVRGSDGSGTHLGEKDMSALTEAWVPIREACGVELSVEAAQSVTIDDAGDTLDGVASIDDEERPADIVIPKKLDELLDQVKAPEGELRLLIWPSAKAVGITPRLYEFGPEYYYEPTVLLYDAFEGGSFVGAEPATGRRYRFALTSDTSAPGTELDWTWELIAIHELGHLLGFSHPDQNSDKTDDFRDNWMAGAHEYPPSFGGTGRFPSVTQRQCILLTRDLSGYARP